jgi:hypothetical protein
MEGVGVGSYLIGLNPNFRGSTSFPHSAVGQETIVCRGMPVVFSM